MNTKVSFIALLTLAVSTTCAATEPLSPDSVLTAAVETPAQPAATTSNAAPQDRDDTWLQSLKKMVKLSGYLQTGYQYNSLGEHTSSFQAKRLRLIADGYVGSKVSFRLQIEAFNGIAGSTNGNGQKNLQVMDAFATMELNKAFKVRVGQYYLPIGYENYDSSPSILETVDFSDICYRMVCRNAITYNVVDYGRDLGVMVFGDVAPSDKGFNYLSYVLSLTNGSLPSKDDVDKSKDLVAALTVRPFKHFSLKGSFNWGQYTGTVNAVKYKNQDMFRYVVGAWYNNPAGLDVRAEYGHIASAANGADVIKEDGFYALAAYNIGKWAPVVRYSMYRDRVNKSTLNNYDALLCGVTYHFNQRWKLQANYIYTMYTDEAKVTNNNQGASSKLQIMGMYKF